ncbi:type I-C CRISPR-associated protein Cas8c/Csd1 [Sellimonas caecigallum]|uniref:Type I-C CRISPR-associated protein Cas8c/Csd1 n=1 Tax=Sellimonas caecigallum TaxID=2592333 RepID=A0ABS7L3V2_9FIRM|nr:type I-C CRISPR-associated protein Cas8c/Csd1 [Sellimonas caecigallum]MBY0757723.1 type I-C CRISPR-associated protein Cas8c/Csd1 [Sellimonas caecigallum]
MSWEEELINLYDKNSSQVGIIQYKLFKKNGKDEKIPYVLLPPFHTTVSAQIQVTLSAEGEFLKASKVGSEDKMTIIPVTEKSGSRTAGKAPHPFCDNLKYLAGDYGRYVQDKKGDIVSYNELYMEELEKWHLSSFSHEKVDAVWHYLKKRTLIQDLIQEKILLQNEEGYLTDEIKIDGVTQSMVFVRFIVRGKDRMEFGQTCDECWKDSSLMDCFIQYYRSLEGKKELDYLTGNIQTASYLHSKKIRNEGDGAKLVSSNDDVNFTFRGRFTTKEQAFAIGNESSQKMHNALKWIIRKQGRSFDTLTMITWESDMKKMPPWDADTETISSLALSDITVETGEEDIQAQFQDDFPDGWKEEKEEARSDGNPMTARQFYSALEGYRKQVENTSHMILMAFDAATTGRLALAEFKTLDTVRYLDNIRKWHEQCGWIQWKYKEGNRKSYYGVPGVRDIADILYGLESNGKLTIADKNGKRLYAELGRRLLPCIWDNRNIPYDLVMTAINRASMPQAYKERYNWERVLTLACSFVKKNRYEREKEEWGMALNKECENRAYLYGRLLAVADRIEYRTFEKEKDNARVTNAKRYMNIFSQRPFETWKIIEENLQPYLNKLPIVERRYYENLIDSICQLFDMDSFRKNDKLDGLYLLGFHSQSYDLKYNKNKANDGGNENE